MRKLFIFCFYLHFTLAYSQGVKNEMAGIVQTSTISNQLDSGLTNFSLPPLSVLIDSAILHSPVIKKNQSAIQISTLKKQLTNVQLLDFINAYSNLSYGTWDYLVTYGESPSEANKYISTQYKAGIELKLSIFDAITHKTSKKIAAEALNISHFDKEEQELKLTTELIDAYTQINLAKELLILAINHFQSQDVLLEMAEKQFLAGNFSLVEYSRIQDLHTKAQEQYLLSRTNLQTKIMLLEEIIGCKLSKFSK